MTEGSGTLPNQQGQVWREYDISPYTARITTTKRPEQAIVDWILRETGYEAWHSEPLGILSATPRALRVYHTPQMQAVVADVVDRFMATDANTPGFSLRVVTVDSPNWRARAQNLLRPVQSQTPGVSVWLVQKENAAILLAEMQRRTDYREHSSPHLLIGNGQSTIVSTMRARAYVRDLAPRPGAWPGYEAQRGQLDEGFKLEFSPLMSLDQRLIDAVIKCEIDQVEKIVPVVMEVATPVAPRQRATLEVPQMAQFRFQERFRWPTDQILLVSLGVVALPVPVDAKSLVPGIPLPLSATPPRADMLLFVESKGPQTAALPSTAGPVGQPVQAGQREARTFPRRY